MAAIRKTSEYTYVFVDQKNNTLDDIDSSCRLDKYFGFHDPRYDLGALDRLPLEVVHLALIRLDLRSLTDFRRVNKRARLVTDSIPQYKHILAHTPGSIRASLNIGTARFFSCQDLYEKLSTAECDSCGDFAGYLYLITCRRVCFLCFTEKVDYLPLLRKDAIRKFGLCSDDLASLPCMRSFPGRYSPRGIKCRRRETLLDYSAARRAGIAVHGTVSSMEEYASEMLCKRVEAYNSRSSGRTGTNRRPPRSEDLFDGHCSNPRRFIGVICAPFFNVRIASPDWGFHCIACKAHHYGRPLHWRRKYTDKNFQDHLSECGKIRDGKHIANMA